MVRHRREEVNRRGREGGGGEFEEYGIKGDKGRRKE